MNNPDSEKLDGLPTGGADGERGGAAPPSALPCLYCDNCIEGEVKKGKPYIRLTPNQKVIRIKVIMAVELMVKKYGIEYVGLLTLSFGVPGSGKGSFETWSLRQQAKVWEFVQKRWHSFRTNIIAKRYKDWVCVFELHRDGVWHIHVVVVTNFDLRTGTNIEILSNYSLPYWQRRGKHLRNEELGREWKTLREICCGYRFGRVELLPVKKTGEALGKYVAGYLAKTYQNVPAGQRRRVVRFSASLGGEFRDKFSVYSLGNLIYRTRLCIVARMLDFQDYDDFAEYFGSHWPFKLKGVITWVPMPFRFQKGDFASGLAARSLRSYARSPQEFLDEREKSKLEDVARELWRRLEDALGENSEELVKLRSRRLGDNWNDRPATLDDQAGLFDDPLLPF